MTGQYAHNIDAKGRLFIPSKLREELGDVFYVTVGQDGCLSVHSDQSWQELRDKPVTPTAAAVCPAGKGSYHHRRI